VGAALAIAASMRIRRNIAVAKACGYGPPVRMAGRARHRGEADVVGSTGCFLRSIQTGGNRNPGLGIPFGWRDRRGGVSGAGATRRACWCTRTGWRCVRRWVRGRGCRTVFEHRCQDRRGAHRPGAVYRGRPPVADSARILGGGIVGGLAAEKIADERFGFSALLDQKTTVVSPMRRRWGRGPSSSQLSAVAYLKAASSETGGVEALSLP